MMPTIRVDAEVRAQIQSRALAFESPNNTIRRALGLPPLERKRGRAAQVAGNVQKEPSWPTTAARPAVKRYVFTTHDLPGAEDEAVREFADFLANHAAQSLGEDSGGYWATLTHGDLLEWLSAYAKILAGDGAEETEAISRVRGWIEGLPYDGGYVNLMIAY